MAETLDPLDVLKVRTDVAFAEFTALRAEMDQRGRDQVRLIIYNYLVVGALASFIFQQQSHPLSLLLIIPPLSVATSILFGDNARIIFLGGGYVADRLWPTFEAAGNGPIPCWERYWVHEFDGTFSRALGALPWVFSFLTTSATAVVVYLALGPDGPLKLVAGFELLLVLLMFLVGLTYYRRRLATLFDRRAATTRLS